MNTTRSQKPTLLILAAGLALATSASAGIFKHITIDGSFGDWAGVTPAFSRSEPDSTTSVAYKDIYVANDEDYLYIRFTLFSAADPFTSHENIFIDADSSAATGYSVGGGLVGSEMLIQGGNGYQEKNGSFNEGGIDGLDWASGPAGAGTDFEVRISRKATYATDSTPVFTSDYISLLLEAEDASWTPVEFAPDNGGLFYIFEAAPGVLTTNLELINLAGASWQVNGAGTDLGTEWLDSAYNDFQPGWNSGYGLFGFTPTPAAYPAIQTPLSSGPNTYYFRTHFYWNNSSSNLAFVVTNYLSDGAVLYLNGAEVQRVRMPEGAIGYNTTATGVASPEGSADVFGISGGPLIIGDNILEVETHQAADSAQDMVFGLSLTAAAQFPVMILQQPADRSVVAGDATTFTAGILASGPLSYQWLKDGVSIADATNASLTLPFVLAADAAAYSLRVSNPVSTNTTRGAVLTVTTTPVVLVDLTQPADQNIVQGNPVTFAVVASGSAPLQYQWFKDDSAITDATNASFTIASAQPSDAGSYYAQVSNSVSSTNSRTAVLAVLLDTTPPTLADVQGSPSQVAVTFSKPVDPASAGETSHYTLDGGLTVVSATVAADNPTQVILTTSPQTLGSVYTLSVTGVQDPFGNTIAANSRQAFLSTVIIDGSFDDWASLTPLYTSESNSPTATNWKDIYVFNDVIYLYMRITTWDPTTLAIWYNNFFFDTDNNPVTGYADWGGSDMLIQGGAAYDERQGGFNDGDVAGLDWLCVPDGPATDFEFRISRSATYVNDGAPVFSTNVVNFAFDAENTSYVTVNRVPPAGMGVLSYTLVEPPPLPPGPLAVSMVGTEVHITWTGTATLQSCGSLVSPQWTNVPSASSPYVVTSPAGQQYFRLER